MSQVLTQEQMADAERLRSIWKSYKTTKGVDNEWLARRIDRKAETVSGYISGKAVMGAKIVRVLAAALEVDPAMISPTLAPAISSLPKVVFEAMSEPAPNGHEHPAAVQSKRGRKPGTTNTALIITQLTQLMNYYSEAEPDGRAVIMAIAEREAVIGKRVREK